jgi:hypothetical protein
MYATKQELRKVTDYQVKVLDLGTYRENPDAAVRLHREGYRVIVRDSDGADRLDIPPFTLDQIVINEDDPDALQE